MYYLTNDHDIINMIDLRYMHNISVMPVSEAVVNRMSWVPMIYGNKSDPEWPDVADQMQAIFGRPIQEVDPSTQIFLDVGDRLYIPIRQYDPDARDEMVIRFIEVRIDV